MDYEKLVISSRDIVCSEVSEDVTALNAKFIICSFDVNGNNVKLNRKTIGDWIYTLVNQPVVAKIGISDSGEADFTSHNMQKVVRQNEKGEAYTEIVFDTSACGVFTNVSIENINGKEFITAEAKLWKRFPEFCAIVKKRILEGTLNTSWEVEYSEWHMEMQNGKKIKVIDKGTFLGHALLASYIPPAYKESQLLEVASEDDDNDLVDALSKDLIGVSNILIKKEDASLTDINNKPEEQIQDTNTPAASQAESEVAMLTEFDLRRALRKAIAEKLEKCEWDFDIVFHFPANGIAWIQMWDAPTQLDVMQFTYSVDNDVVSVSEPVEAKLTVSVSQINETIVSMQAKIDEQAESIVQANATINEQAGQIVELSTYKEKFEAAEQEKIAKEIADNQEALKQYAIKSGLITETEIAEDAEISAAIAQVDKAKINVLIAERFMSNQSESQSETEVETSNKTEPISTREVKRNLETSEEVPAYRAFMNSFLGK